jgi:uncharacterized YccA/Bax inhibitor family protein
MSNPILNEKNFNEQARVYEGAFMTVNGTIQVAVFLALILVCTATFVWSRYSSGYMDIATMLTGGGLIVGIILGFIIAFTRNKYLVPIYAAAEGCFIGGTSAIFESQYPGIVVQAVAGTFAALFMMLVLYKIGLIRATEKFRSVIFITTASIAVVYLVDIIGRLFLHLHVPVINSASPFGILVSIGITAVAALNLIIDFDFVEQGERMMLPKDYEWIGAFGLMVTLVWLYLEILRLLAKLNSKR